MNLTNSPLLAPSRFIAVASISVALALTASLRAADAPAAATPAPAAAKSGATTFADVKPLLTKYCYTCHGGPLTPAGANGPAQPATKSGLSLDTLENAIKGGRSKKPGIVPGKAADSEIIVRLNLAASKGKGFMPPAGKPAPTADEIKLITDWVNAGAK